MSKSSGTTVYSLIFPSFTSKMVLSEQRLISSILGFLPFTTIARLVPSLFRAYAIFAHISFDETPNSWASGNDGLIIGPK